MAISLLVCVFLFLSVCFPSSLYVCFTPSLYVSLSLSLSVYLSPSLLLLMYLSLTLTLSLFLSLPLSPPLYVCLSLCSCLYKTVLLLTSAQSLWLLNPKCIERVPVYDWLPWGYIGIVVKSFAPFLTHASLHPWSVANNAISRVIKRVFVSTVWSQ